jgi:uncharacterized membrane protein HdeD (DUF308 family)
MLAVLAADWGLLLTRALLALMLGISAFAWPGLTLIPFVVLFGVYSLLDGIAVLIVAFGAKGLPVFGSLMFEGLVRLGAGLIALAIPGQVALVFPAFLAAWAGLSGVGQIAVAIVLRKELTGEWPLPIAGALSLLVAVFVAANPGGGVLSLVWFIGPYSILFGFVLMVLTYRMWQLAHEMTTA